jgi:hypothetical protein
VDNANPRAVAVLILMFVLTIGSTAGAVLPPGAEEQRAAQAPLIVIARVVSVRPVTGGRLPQARARFKVLSVFRGPARVGQEIEVGYVSGRPANPRDMPVGPRMCFPKFAPGNYVVLFLHPARGRYPASLVNSGCSVIMKGHTSQRWADWLRKNQPKIYRWIVGFKP